ncbi:phospholipase D-like domain-containing protein [Bacillus thuringiensis]|uniref:phospholipase D-like domain-containing protein n=1 Tax=Bacillus cereus group TaxID=86661 RepID=UPI000F8A1DAA|nr:phospholipase D-like domain-containing protein [Bacillus thuringiensis]AZR76744.1 phosphatidylserine synthase [Bacillus thuringiensis]MBG9518695.1 phosphatidylserine synthase [Bacillus thuringiensis]
MNEQQFLKTMIETVKWGDYENDAELLGILRNSIITYDRTSTFGGKSNYFREYVCLRVPIPMMKTAKKLKGVLEELASEVYMEPTDTYQDYEFWGLRIKPKPVELDTDSYVDHNVIFDDIKEEIIQGIRNAKYTIWIAVAWFTDEDIFNELLLRKKEGVNIRIITSDEKTNTHIIDKLEGNFEVVKVGLKGDYLKNRLHDKFCIIDLEYVMHGSYNWSKNARNNDETWATALDRDFVRKFVDEFLRLYVEN